MYVSVGLTEQARDALRTTTLNLTTPAGRRVTLSEVLLALVTVGQRHPDEVLAVLRGTPEVAHDATPAPNPISNGAG